MAGSRREPSKATRDIFVNRRGPIETIKRAVAGLGAADSKLLVFYGRDGQGKTALCQHIAQRLSATARAENHAKILIAELDLHAHRELDPDRLPVWIRNGFVRAGVPCPTFDLAFPIVWQANRPEAPFPKLEQAWLAKTREFSGDGITAVRKVAQNTVRAIPLLGPLLTRGARWFVDRFKPTPLHRASKHLAKLYIGDRLKEPYELSALMPWILAQDLNDHLSRHTGDRFVLLVDEYERVFDQGGAGQRWQENPFDQALRRIVAETKGLLAVFFTRDRLPWTDDPDWRADLEGRQHALEGLPDADAGRWLQEAGVTDATLRAAMIDGARDGAPAEALACPLLLALQIAHWEEIQGRNELPKPADFKVEGADFNARCRALLGRLLRGHGTAWEDMLQRLCVADRFDRAAFDHVRYSFGKGLEKDAFDRLLALPFVRKDEDGFLTLHRTIRAALRASLKPEHQREAAVRLLAHYEPRATPASPQQIDETHRSALFEAMALRQQLGPEGFAAWLFRVIEPFRLTDWARTGELIWRDALSFLEAKLGAEHPLMATSYNTVGLNLNAQGRYDQAEPLFRKCLEIRKQVLGEDHPDTTTSYNNLASNLNSQGRYAQAEPLYRKALETRKRVLGDAQPLTALSYNNVASNLNSQARYAEAEPLYRKGLEIHKQALGEEHTATAMSYNNVASNLNAQGRYAEAEPLYRRALEIHRQAHGEEHPDTAAGYNNVAHNLDAEKRYAEAEPLYRKALDIYERVLGEAHPSTAGSYNNLASTLNSLERYAEAEPLYRKSLEIYRRALGEAHPSTAMSYNNVAHNLSEQGRYAEAEPLCRKGLEIRERVLGEAHPDTAASYNNIASNLNSQGRYKEAEPLFRKAVEIMERALGPKHPHSATLRRNLEIFLKNRRWL